MSNAHARCSVARSLCCASDPDERRGWWIVALAFAADALTLGGRGLYSVAILYFEQDFSMARSTSSSLKSLVHIMIAISTILSGQIADTCPPIVSLGGALAFLSMCYALVAVMQSDWQVWLVYGGLCGTAWGGLNLNVFSVAVMRCMPPERQGMAVSAATTGSTFGMFALVPLFSIIARRHGWRTGYGLLSASVACLAVPALLLLRTVTPGSSGQEMTASSTTINVEICAEDGAAVSNSPQLPPAAAQPKRSPPLGRKLRSLLGSRTFWILSIAFVVCGITTTGFIETHIVALAVRRGEDEELGALCFSVLSAFNGVGMLCAGWLADRYSRSLILSVIFAVRGISFILLSARTDTPTLFAFACLFGLVRMHAHTLRDARTHTLRGSTPTFL